MVYQWDSKGWCNGVYSQDNKAFSVSRALDIRAGLFAGILGIHAKAVVQLLPGSLCENSPAILPDYTSWAHLRGRLLVQEFNGAQIAETAGAAGRPAISGVNRPRADSWAKRPCLRAVPYSTDLTTHHCTGDFAQ